jgi:tetratricopeptide (TPR) repeat protein
MIYEDLEQQKPMGRRTIRKAAMVAMLGLAMCLGGCADLKKTFNFKSIDEEGTEEKLDLNFPAKSLLAKGMDDYNVGKYFTAIEFFQEILNRYPFSPEAPLAELKAADCSYHLERYQEALVLYEEFANRHPTNESIPYVLFQRGMSNFKQLDRVDRDTVGATKAIEFFKQLLKPIPIPPMPRRPRPVSPPPTSSSPTTNISWPSFTCARKNTIRPRFVSNICWPSTGTSR